MKIYQLQRQQMLKLSLDEAWDFFSSPYHLNDITPDFFHIDICSPVPESIYPGLMLSYQMRAVFGIPMAWLSEISHCQPKQRFVYEQRIGPFRFWSHEVCLSETATGLMLEDIVFYVMPLSWLGQLLHRLLIGQKLQAIFDTRRDYLASRWGT